MHLNATFLTQFSEISLFRSLFYKKIIQMRVTQEEKDFLAYAREH